ASVRNPRASSVGVRLTMRRIIVGIRTKEGSSPRRPLARTPRRGGWRLRHVELILKAFILIKGGTEREVREIRHDLLKAWERATKRGLRPNDKRAGEIVTMLAPYHLDHSFRYRKTRFVTLPVYRELCEVVEGLVMQIGPEVDHAMRAEIRAKRAASK